MGELIALHPTSYLDLGDEFGQWDGRIEGKGLGKRKVAFVFYRPISNVLMSSVTS